MFQVFTIESGSVAQGAAIRPLQLKGAGVTIPVIEIGEEGRGRQRGILPVQLTFAQRKQWDADESIIILMAASVAETRAGKPKLIAVEKHTSTEKCICVFRTKIGFRGGNEHTGDRTGEVEEDRWGKKVFVFRDFPGEILVEGRIAQGAAGGAGGGAQLVAVMPRDVWFRTGYRGRLYGKPRAHYYKFDGEKIIAVTWEERELLEEAN
jgi:hypothetical protein